MSSSYLPIRDHAPNLTATGASGTNKVPLAVYVMVALALIGIADASYVAQSTYTGRPLWCPIIDGCNTVANSPYARIIGVPLSYFGLVFYLGMLALAALLVVRPFSRALRVSAVLYAAIGVGSSIYFMYVQLSFIQAVCIYCLVSGITTLVLLVAAVWHARATLVRSMAIPQAFT
jgi:uncharacterized membrane protein